MRIGKKMLLTGLAALCVLGGRTGGPLASAQAHEGKQRPGTSSAEARFELAAPEKTDKDSEKKKKEKASPAPTYRPIKGVRLAVQNRTARTEKENMEQMAREQKKRNRADKALLKQKKAQLKAYRAVQSATEGTCTVFADNGRGNGILQQVSFDGFFAGMADYGVLDAEALIGICWDGMLGRSHAGPGNEADASRPGCAPVSAPYSENYICGVRTVDISIHLSQAILNRENEISSLKKSLEKGRKSLRKLKKECRRINTGDIVFNSKDITEASNIPVSRMKEILAGTELEQYADTYVRIERIYGINAIAICSLSALESRWGTSRRAREDHNYTGFGVYSDSAAGINAGSGEENLLMTARHLAANYLAEGGRYCHGKGLDGVNRSYAASRTWAYNIENIGCRLMERLQAACGS